MTDEREKSIFQVFPPSLSPLRYRNFQLTLDDTETSFARLLSIFSSFSLPKSRTLPQTSLLSLLSNPMDYRIHIGRREDNAGWKQDVYETFIDWSCRAGYCRQRWVSPSIAINIIHTHAIRLREKSGGEKNWSQLCNRTGTNMRNSTIFLFSMSRMIFMRRENTSWRMMRKENWSIDFSPCGKLKHNKISAERWAAVFTQR